MSHTCLKNSACIHYSPVVGYSILDMSNEIFYIIPSSIDFSGLNRVWINLEENNVINFLNRVF